MSKWHKEKCAVYPPKKASVDSGDKSDADQALRDLPLASLETEPA